MNEKNPQKNITPQMARRRVFVQSLITRERNRLSKKYGIESLVSRYLRKRIERGIPPFQNCSEEALQLLGSKPTKTETQRLRSQFRNATALKNTILIRDGFRCSIRGCDGKFLEVDHIRSLAKYPELAFAPSNLRVLCKRHNGLKGSR